MGKPYAPRARYTAPVHHHRDWSGGQFGGIIPNEWATSPEVQALSLAVQSVYFHMARFVDGQIRPFMNGYCSHNEVAAVATVHPDTVCKAQQLLQREGLIAIRHRHTDVDTRDARGAPVPWFQSNRIAFLPPPSLRNDEIKEAVEQLREEYRTPERVPWGHHRRYGKPDGELVEDPVVEQPMERDAPAEPAPADDPISTQAVALWRIARDFWGWRRQVPAEKEMFVARRWVEELGDAAAAVVADMCKYVRRERKKFIPHWLSGLQWAEAPVLSALRRDPPAEPYVPARKVADAWFELLEEVEGMRSAIQAAVVSAEKYTGPKWEPGSPVLQLGALRELDRDLGAIREELIWAYTEAQTAESPEAPTDHTRALIDALVRRYLDLRPKG